MKREEVVCTCVSCPECHGGGFVYYSFPGIGGGQYLGTHRSDDLDEMETCDVCRGRGITEMCESCTDQLSEDETP